MPVLVVHDSFIVQRQHEELLREIMAEAFRANGLISIPHIENNLPDEGE